MVLWRLTNYMAIIVATLWCFPQAFASELNLPNNKVQAYYKSHLRPTAVDGFDNIGISILVIGAISGVLAHRYDNKINRYFNKKERLGGSLTDLGNSFGTRYLNLVVAGIQMIWDRSNGVAHVESLLGTTLMVIAMKKSIHRTRPNQDNEDSFPSGHTSIAFASSGSLSFAYGWKAAIPAYTLTSLTILARLESNKHWFSDLVVATSIGVFWARAAGIHHHYLAPIIFKDGAGVRFTYAF